MIIHCKNKHTIEVENFKFRCCIGKNNTVKNKKEGDLATPKGTFKLEYLLYRKDKIKSVKTKLRSFKIKKNMIWCDDPNNIYYNKLKKKSGNFSYEKIYRQDYRYDYLIPLNYNRKKVIKNKGSAIFIHLTKNYKATSGCIAIKKGDMEILLKIINKKTFIKIY